MYCGVINIGLGLIFIITLVFYYYLTWNYNYWKKRKIPHIKPSIGFGNIKDVTLLRRTFCDVFGEIYKQFHEYKYVGMYLWRSPAIFVRDPEIVNIVLTKNFSSFANNTWYVNKKFDPHFSRNPFIATGAEWKHLRSQVATGLTSGKVKLVFPQVLEAGESLVNYIKQHAIEGNKKALHLQDICLRYTTNAVSLGAFGIDAKAFDDAKSDIYNMVESLFATSVLSTIYSILMMADKQLTNLFRVNVIPPEIDVFFRKITTDVTKYREQNNMVRNDYFDYLLRMRDKNASTEVNEANIVTHSMTLFFDGVGTTAVALTITLHEIAKHPEVFKKLRREIDMILEKYNGQVTPEAVQEMSYLDACIAESLRLIPPVFFTIRTCTERIELPNPKDENGEKLIVEPGVTVIIPTYEIQRDSNHFPDPQRYDPERFSDANKNSIKKYTYFPFNDGPRICIGRNFAILELKIGIIEIVKNFDITLKDASDPLKPDVGATLSIIMLKGNDCLEFHKRGEVFH